MSREQFIRWKEDGLTIKDISETTGRSVETIRKMIRYYDVDYNRFVRENPWDLDKVMNDLDVDGQYVIGFLAADGYLSTDRNSVVTWIQEKDSEILERIKRTLGRPESPVLTRQLRNRQPQAGLYIGSVKLVEHLVAVYGFSNNKSRTLPFPRHLANPLPYLRGFMDGDGYIGNGCTFSCGSVDFVDGLLEWVWRNYGYAPNLQPVGTNRDCYNITFRKKHSEFIHDLFSFPGLYRKTRAYREYLLTQ